MMSKYNVQNGSDEIEQRIKKIEWDNSKTKSKPEIPFTPFVLCY